MSLLLVSKSVTLNDLEQLNGSYFTLCYFTEFVYDVVVKSSRSPSHLLVSFFYILFPFYSARNARIASAVLATALPSVRPSVRHMPVLCQNDGT